MYNCLLSNICSSSTHQNKSAPASRKRAVPRKEGGQTADGGKKQRPPAGPVKVAVVLRAIRGKSSNLRTNHKTSASDRPQVEKKSVTTCPTLSTSTSSLGSDVLDEGPLVSPKKEVQELPDRNETSACVETSHPEDANEEFVKDQRESVGKASMKEAVMANSRNPSRVSSFFILSNFLAFLALLTVQLKRVAGNRVKERGSDMQQRDPGRVSNAGPLQSLST